MLAKELIDIVDDLRPNQYNKETKLRWLSIVDEEIYREIIEPREQKPHEHICYTFTDGELDEQDDLLVPFPYAEDVYVPYLSARIDQANGEIAKYNVQIGLYQSGLTDFRNAWNKEHKVRRSAYWKF